MHMVRIHSLASKFDHFLADCVASVKDGLKRKDTLAQLNEALLGARLACVVHTSTNQHTLTNLGGREVLDVDVLGVLA
jgi:hypothetical protein